MNESAVSVSNAAKMVARPESTIRDWVKKDLIKYNKDIKGRLLIDKTSLLQHVQHIASSIVRTGAVLNPTVQDYPLSHSLLNAAASDASKEELIQQLKETLQLERTRNERLEQKNSDLQSELLKINKEMQAILQKETGLMGWIRSKK